MKYVSAALLVLLELVSTAAAQSDASITDAELALFCSFDVPVATGLTAADVKQRLVSLAASEQAARQTLDDPKSTAAQRAEAQDFVDNLPERRNALEQTLADLANAEVAARRLPTCTDTDEATSKAMCAAYRAGRPIPWNVATQIAKCMREQIVPARRVQA